MVVLIDLENEQRYPITQDLGPGSAACALDPGLMADAAQVMRRIADEGADLAIFNRFGALEAEGGGLAAEMLEAAENRGGAVKKRDEVHRMAEANKAFAHFRF